MSDDGPLTMDSMLRRIKALEYKLMELQSDRLVDQVDSNGKDHRYPLVILQAAVFGDRAVEDVQIGDLVRVGGLVLPDDPKTGASGMTIGLARVP